MKLIPAILGRQVNDLERKLFSLPARYGGLGIFNPDETSDFSFANSKELSAPLVELIVEQDRSLNPSEMKARQKQIRQIQKKKTEKRHEDTLDEVKSVASDGLNLCIKIAVEDMASSWVTARPMFSHSTVMHKGDFRDAIYLRYGMTPPNLPSKCGCQAKFTVQHAMECMLGGFRGLLHNEVTHVIHDAMKDAGYKDVGLEPQLQALEGESFKLKSANKSDEARSDIKVLSFWSRMRRAFFDTTAFSPYTNHHKTRNLKSLYRADELRKMREYKDRIMNVEHADFTPLVFCTAGGMGPQASVTVKRIAERLSEKKELPRSVVSGWLKCKISFALLRSSIVCLRGTRPYRPKKQDNQNEVHIDLAVSEARIAY